MNELNFLWVGMCVVRVCRRLLMCLARSVCVCVCFEGVFVCLFVRLFSCLFSCLLFVCVCL